MNMYVRKRSEMGIAAQRTPEKKKNIRSNSNIYTKTKMKVKIETTQDKRRQWRQGQNDNYILGEYICKLRRGAYVDMNG